MTIWKFELSLTDVQPVSMPIGALIIHCDLQRNIPCLWAIVDEDADRQIREFATYGTGHTMKEDASHRHIGSFLMHNGLLVFHVFEVTEE